MRKQPVLLHIIAITAAIAVMLLHYNKVANWHYHQLENGLVIEHAHPFKASSENGKPFEKHQHTELELIILADLFNAIAWIILAMALSLLLVNQSRQEGIFYRFFLPQPGRWTMRQLRAPPAC